MTKKKKSELAEELVERILIKYPETRGSDIELHLRAWEEQGLILSYYQKAAFRNLLFNTETVRRSRQRIQEIGKYWPSEGTRRYRELMRKRLKNKYSKNKQQTIKEEYIPQYDNEGKLQGYLIK